MNCVKHGVPYKVIKENTTVEGSCKVGDIVYQQKGYDYGLSSDDTRLTGIEHVTVTHNADGDYPGFTIPRHNLEELVLE